jgi:predicted alpha/beta-hydrolase family hydrolase
MGSNRIGTDCPIVVNASNYGGRRTSPLQGTDATQEDIDDLNARGYPVKFCKCTKGRSAS